MATTDSIIVIIVFVIIALLFVASCYFSYKVFKEICKFVKKELFSD